MTKVMTSGLRVKPLLAPYDLSCLWDIEHKQTNTISINMLSQEVSFSMLDDIMDIPKTPQPNMDYDSPEKINPVAWIYGIVMNQSFIHDCVTGAYSRCSKISNTNRIPKRSRQTVQTQIRLLLKKQSDQRLPYLLF